MDGQRRRRFLAENVGDARGAVWNPPVDGPMFFTRMEAESTLDLLVPGEGTVQVVTLDAPGLDRVDLLLGTPEGALLAVQTYPLTTVWRAEDSLSGSFELVHEHATNTDPDPTLSTWVHEPIVVGTTIHLATPRGVVMSDDDGRTWTEVTTWR